MKNSTKTIKDTIIPIALTLTLIVGIGIGTYSVMLSSANNGDTVPYPQIRQEFPVNENGQTYGEAANCFQPEEFPDLVGVHATNGKGGYAYYTDLYDESLPSTIEEAKKLNEQGIFKIYIPVYESDGKTVIGEFGISINSENAGVVKVED